MKFKIFCVLIIAACVAVVLGLALKSKDKTVDPAATANQSVNGTVPDSKVKLLKPEPGRGKPLAPATAAVAPPAPEVVQEISEEKAIRMEERRQKRILESEDTKVPVEKDQVDFLQDSVNKPSVFFGLRIPIQVSVVSLALNMNDEQEVMLTSYLEAQQKFRRDPSNEKFVRSITERQINSDAQQYGVAPQASVDELVAMTEIIAQELKELQGLKATFVNGLTKQQQEKFATLAIATHL